MRGMIFAIGMGIALLTPMLIKYGVNLISPPPDPQEYFIHEPPPPAPMSQEESERRRLLSEQQQEAYNAHQLEHQKVFFYVALPIGIVLVIAGSILTTPAVGTGLAFGGVFTLIAGYWSYWYHLSDGIKFGSLLIALICLILTAYRRFSKIEA